MDTDTKQPPAAAPAAAPVQAMDVVAAPQTPETSNTPEGHALSTPPSESSQAVAAPPEIPQSEEAAPEGQTTKEPLQTDEKPAPAAPKQPSTVPKGAIAIATVVFIVLAIVTYLAYIKGQ